jgi:hypothetical protein
LLPVDVSSSILAVSVSIVAALLLTWLWFDRTHRQPGLSPEDAQHFRFQDARRIVVAATMFVLSVGLYAGARLETRLDGRPNLWYVQLWLGIALLVLLLFILASFDWLATQRYARRHRRAMVREGLEIVRDELRLRMAARNADELLGEQVDSAEA